MESCHTYRDIKYLEYARIQSTINKTVYTTFCLHRRSQGTTAQFIKQSKELFHALSTEQLTAILGDCYGSLLQQISELGNKQTTTLVFENRI